MGRGGVENYNNFGGPETPVDANVTCSNFFIFLLGR